MLEMQMGSLGDFVNCSPVWKLCARKDNANDCFVRGSLLQLASTFGFTELNGKPL